MQPQTRRSPVIVGDHYELAETAAWQYSPENHDDLLAKATFSAGLLPMSSYANPNVNGKLPHFDSTAPLDLGHLDTSLVIHTNMPACVMG